VGEAVRERLVGVTFFKVLASATSRVASSARNENRDDSRWLDTNASTGPP